MEMKSRHFPFLLVILILFMGSLSALCIWLYFDCRRLEKLLAAVSSLEAPAAEGLRAH